MSTRLGRLGFEPRMDVVSPHSPHPPGWVNVAPRANGLALLQHNTSTTRVFPVEARPDPPTEPQKEPPPMAQPDPKPEQPAAGPALVRELRGTPIYRGFDTKARNGRGTDYPWGQLEVGEQFFLREGASSSGSSRATKLLAPKKFSVKSDVIDPATGKPAKLVTRVR